MRSGASRTAALALLALAAARGSALRADWLLMLDGSRLETRGAWEVRGPQVVLTLPNGTLATVPVAKVDLPGSARITAEALAPKPASAPAAPRKPVLTLTDADLAHADVAPAAAGSQAASPAGRPPASGAADPAAGLEVVSWSTQYHHDTQTTTVSGTVRNTRPTLAYNLQVVASIYDANGGLIAKSAAALSNRDRGIGGGESTTFTLEYPGAVTIADAKFELSAQRVVTQAEAAPVATPTPKPAAAAEARLQIGSWQPDPQAQAGSTVLVGNLVNASSEIAYGVTLEVTLHGADGKELASAQALLASPTLQPGESTYFRASFPGVASFADAAFAARHKRRTG
jgi:hypothetical protein